MKKLVMMLVCMFAVHTMVMADNDKPIEVSQLPKVPREKGQNSRNLSTNYTKYS